MKELTMERRRTKAEGWRVISGVAGVGVNWKAASEARSSGSAVRYPGKLGVGVTWRTEFTEEKEGSGTERVGRDAGVRMGPAR